MRYLSHASDQNVQSIRPPDQILANLVRQPSSRVRGALIPLLLSHPEYQNAIFQARSHLRGPRRRLLELFYTAAMFLQRKHQRCLIKMQGETFRVLIDLFSKSLGIPAGLSPEESLARLAVRHEEISGLHANWVGTYESAFQHWFRYHQKEHRFTTSSTQPATPDGGCIGLSGRPGRFATHLACPIEDRLVSLSAASGRRLNSICFASWQSIHRIASSSPGS